MCVCVYLKATRLLYFFGEFPICVPCVVVVVVVLFVCKCSLHILNTNPFIAFYILKALSRNLLLFSNLKLFPTPSPRLKVMFSLRYHENSRSGTCCCCIMAKQGPMTSSALLVCSGKFTEM